MRTTNTFRTCILAGALLAFFCGPVNGASYSTDASISGTTPITSYSYGNTGYGWTSGYSNGGASRSYGDGTNIDVGATGRDSTPSDPVNLMNTAGLFLQNSQVIGTGPWSSSFANGSMKSGLYETFNIGSYTASTGSLVDGILKIDLGLSYSSWSNTQPTSGSNALFGSYLSFGPGIDLFLGSSISANLQSWGPTSAEFTGSTWLNAGNLAGSDHASTILEIPFSTTVGSTLILDTELVTNFLVTWNPAFVYSEMIGVSSYDPIVLDIQTPDAYFLAGGSNYYGPDQFVAKVNEPSELALILIGLSSFLLRRRT